MLKKAKKENKNVSCTAKKENKNVGNDSARQNIFSPNNNVVVAIDVKYIFQLQLSAHRSNLT